MSFQDLVSRSFSEGKLPEKYYRLLLQFYMSYKEALKKGNIEIDPYEKLFCTFLEKIEKQITDPFVFLPYHEKVTQPFNHYQFGIDFMSPLIDLEHSSFPSQKILDEIRQKLAAKENVIFLANHQIEADPQVISILLQDQYPDIAENLIFVAGERVVTDPLAVPFSMGCNLLCIYSKRHIDYPPELKPQKQIHNKKTMELMSRLLSEGGHAIYVAPSGGRDRADASGKVNVAHFDPQSIEMFYLMTKKAERPTSFYPMALFTYDLLPPPEDIQRELGEERKTQRAQVHLAVGPEIPMENIPHLEEIDKRKRREERADFIWAEVCKLYKAFPIPSSSSS